MMKAVLDWAGLAFVGVAALRTFTGSGCLRTSSHFNAGGKIPARPMPFSSQLELCEDVVQALD